MLWIIILGLFLILLLWLLFSPIYFRVEWNDLNQVVQLHWWGVVRISLLPEMDVWTFRVEFPLFTRSWPMSQWWSSTKEEPQKKAKPGRKRSWKPKRPWQLFRRVWRSFHLIRFKVDLDTDDYVWNAYLFPLFRLTNPAGHKDWRVNFKGHNELILIVENRLYRLLYAFIRAIA